MIYYKQKLACNSVAKISINATLLQMFWFKFE